MRRLFRDDFVCVVDENHPDIGDVTSPCGADGHIIDLRGSGGYQLTTTLLVETFGRKSGVRRIIPLVYGLIAGEIFKE